MQGGQQFKLDQPGLMKAAPVALIVGAVAGALYIVFGLWSIAGILGWIVPIFGGVWYVMTARKAGMMPSRMDGLVNGAILGALVGLAYGLLALITLPIGLNSAPGGFGGVDETFAGFSSGAIVGILITVVILGALLGAAGAFGYSYLVKSGTVK